MNNLNELRLKALKESSLEEQIKLMKNPDFGVRRNLALNPFLKEEIANELAYDKVVNVSFCALKNKNCTVKRVLNKNDLKNKCVVCEKIDPIYSECSRC